MGGTYDKEVGIEIGRTLYKIHDMSCNCNTLQHDLTTAWLDGSDTIPVQVLTFNRPVDDAQRELNYLRDEFRDIITNLILLQNPDVRVNEFRLELDTWSKSLLNGFEEARSYRDSIKLDRAPQSERL